VHLFQLEKQKYVLFFKSARGRKGGSKIKKNPKYIFKTNIIFKTYFTKQKKARGRMEGKKSTGLIKKSTCTH